MTITYPLSIPATPGIQTSAFQMRNVVAVTESVFTGQQQVFAHDGQIWAGEISLPPMRRTKAAEWQAFLAKLKGRKGTFLFGDPDAKAFQGVGGGTPVLAGAHVARATSINLRGLAESTTWAKAFDYIQIGTGANARLHVLLSDVDSTAGSPQGEATADIWPHLREAYGDGESVITANCEGVFRLTSNAPGWSADEAAIYGISFGIVEAL